MSTKPISISASLRWVGVSQAGRILLQMVGVAILARILPPRDYGLMAMAATVTVFAGLLRDMGTGAALIQREDLAPSLINAVFWFNVSLGLLLMFLTWALSPLVAGLFHEPRLRDVLLALAPVFPIAAIGIAQRSLLERESRFRELATIELATAGIALALAIVLALQDAGVYALVAQSLVSALCFSLLLWRVSRWRPSLDFRFAELRELFHFSGNLFLFNILNYFHRNADTVLVGRFLGSANLGIYDVAYRILLFPLQNLTFAINRAMLPAYSRQQNDRAALATHYLSTLRTIALLTAPLMGLLWVLREPFVLVVFGQKWLPVGDVIAWLAPVGFLQSVVSTSGAVLAATGNTRMLRNLGFVGVPFFVLSFVVGLSWGVVGVAAAYCIANIFWIFPVLHVSMRSLGQRALPAHKAWALPALLSCVGVISVALLQDTDAWRQMRPLLQLVAGVVVGVPVCLAASFMWCRQSMMNLLSNFRLG